MTSFEEEARTDVPTLPQKYSGIPQILLDTARAAKKQTFGQRTKPQNDRQRVPVIPQGVEKDTFFEALDALRKEIGTDNVELNDRPLKDGW